MSQIHQAKCPGCKKPLQIPADRIGQAVRCKHCGANIRTKPKAPKKESAILAVLPVPDPSPASPPLPAPDIVREKFEKQPFADLHQDNSNPFEQLDAGSGNGVVVPRIQTRRPSSSWKTIGLVLGCAFGVMVIAVAVCAVTLGKSIFGLQQVNTSLTGSSRSNGPDKASTTDKKDMDLPIVTTPFPRRALLISVNNYYYANPVTYGDLDRTGAALLGKLSTAFHVPSSQMAELSDGAKEPKPPLKSVIEDTITDFLGGCRAQDRAILLFIGHAVAIENEAFLVPIEGDLKTKETLIPLAWLYDKLAKCKARQKVLILDVCRFDPARGSERPGSGPMAPKLDEALRKPPAGVQVWSACAAGQFSYEGAVDLPGKRGRVPSGLFLNEICESLEPLRKYVNLGIQQPTEPLPVDLLATGTRLAATPGEAGRVNAATAGVNQGTEIEVDAFFKAKQTPFLSGQEAAGGAPYDASEALPAKPVVRLAQLPPGGVASIQLVRSILQDTSSIPPVKMKTKGVEPLRAESLPPFSAKVLEAYKDDNPKTPFREAVFKARDMLVKYAKSFREDFYGKEDDAKIKAQILEYQKKGDDGKGPALIYKELDDALTELKKAGAERDKEQSKRWQANYDYVLARLQQRIAYVREYSYILGQIRKDALPPRDPAKHSGWRLASQERLRSDADTRKLAAEAKKTLQRIAKEHKDTPWEILAKRESQTALGLEWQPTR